MGESAAESMSWQQKELLGALKRLVTARERLEGLEAQAGVAPASVVDPADVDRANALLDELAEARDKARGRFGKKWVEKVESLELNLRLVLDRLGCVDEDEYRARRRELAAPPVDAVDPTVLEFARRELAAAEAGFLEIQTLEVPEAEPEPEIDLTDATTAEEPPSHTQSA